MKEIDNMQEQTTDEEWFESWKKLYAKDMLVIGDFVYSLREKEYDTYKLYFEDGTIIIADYYGGFDSENGLELDDPFYEEYYAFDFRIKQIIKKGSKLNFEGKEILFLNYHNFFERFEPIED